MQAAKGRSHGAGSGSGSGSRRAAKAAGARLGGRLGAGRGGLAVEQHRLSHMGEVILSNDDAHVAWELEVDLRERPIMAAAGRQWSGMERVRLAVWVEEGTAVRVEQVSGVRLLCRRVERCCGRGAVGSAGALAAAEELTEHGGEAEAGDGRAQ